MGVDDVNLDKVSTNAFVVVVTTEVLKPNGAFIVQKRSQVMEVSLLQLYH